MYIFQTFYKKSSKDVNHRINQRRKSITNREVQLLIKDGADVNFIDCDGNTALHYAVSNDKLEVVKYLLQLPAVEITHENNANATPLDLARERNVKPIVNLIEEQIWRNAPQTVSSYYPRHSRDNTSWSTKTSEVFMEATFAGNCSVPLQVDDVRNIVQFKYFKDKEEIICVVTESNEDLLNFLGENKENAIKYVILACLYDFRWTVVVIDFNVEDRRFVSYIEDAGSKDLIKAIEMYFTLDIRTYKFPYVNYESIRYDSAVYALKLADLFHINSNYEQVIQNDWCSFDINAEKIFLAYLLNEKQRTEQKMVACSSLFKRLVAQKENIVDLTHQNINAFVLFLETFALEDTYVSEGESKLKEIRKIKKEYFSHFYFQPKNEKVEGKPDYRLISDARNSLLHISRILTLDECRKFIGKNLQIQDFFINMCAFTESMCTNVLSAQYKVKVIKCSSFLAEKTEYKHIGAEDDLEQLGKFLKNLYITENNITDVTLQEIMFDLIVNVIPLLDSKREKVGPLGDVRNDLLHNF